ncbi:YciI family protein [Litchfieldella rifensis]|uniref:YciI family protein n=1 Tax=Litchfieldella rifensis TaxID=762643 RepID=A0ABV7LPY2_9GAMM
MKYLCLAYEEERKLNDLSQSEWEALRKETLDYVDALRKSGHLIMTQALQSATRATTLRVRNGKLSATDGPFAETKEQIGGFFLIEAEGFDEAARIAAEWPSARIGSIEVRPIEEELSHDRRYR